MGRLGSFVIHSKSIPPDAPILDHFKKDFGFQQFVGTFGTDFGYEGSLKFLGQTGPFLEYQVPTPLCRKITKNQCEMCEGSGKDEFRDGEKCYYCDGEGKKVIYDYTEAFAVSASLTTLFELMRFPPDIHTSATDSQLICVETVTIKNAHGGSIGGEYSGEVVDFLRLRPNGSIPSMIEAMMETWKKVEGRLLQFDNFSFSAYTQGNNGWLNTSCSGDACGLHPAHGTFGCNNGNRGYAFSCHNADNPMQQLVMLASLAALHDLVRPR